MTATKVETELNSFDEKLRWQFQKADGYLDLSMADQAHRELDRVPEEFHHGLVYTHFLLKLSFVEEDWKQAVDRARELIDQCPEHIDYWVKLGYAVRRGFHVAEAERILKQAMKRFPGEAIFPYNLACYAAVQGRQDESLGYLRQACEIEPNYIRLAQGDEDLISIQERLRELE